MRFQPDIHCPECGGSDVARSHRGNKLETVVSQLARLWPLRCLECHKRWFVFSARDPKKILNTRVKKPRPRV